MELSFQKKRSGKKRKSPDKSKTVPLSEKQTLPGAAEKGARIQPAQLIVGCGQSVGKQRDHNEDSLFTFTVTVGSDDNAHPLGLYLIADGMGGHQHGEIASRVAVHSMAGHILRKFHTYLSNPSETPDEPLQDILRAAVVEAQRAVTRAAPGSGTTLTAALVLDHQVTFAHVGDTRAYAVHPDGRLDTLTRDHSLVKRLEELGQLSSDEAAISPQRNVLYRALGQGEVLEPDVFTLPFPQPGFLMLCSDGLWGVVSEETMLCAIRESPTVTGACQRMVEAANAAGGPDNITAILIQLLD